MTDDPSQSLTGKVLDDLAGGKVVLVDTSGLEAVEETLVASLLTRSLLDERADAYRNDRERFGQLPRTLVALEEAQRVLTRLDDAEFNVFPRLAREGRKFNVGLCAVTQQPKLIDPSCSASSTPTSCSAWPTSATATPCGPPPSRTCPTSGPRSRP
jgi:hypothetical protein